jgi:hypothetical protein
MTRVKLILHTALDSAQNLLKCIGVCWFPEASHLPVVAVTEAGVG